MWWKLKSIFRKQTKKRVLTEADYEILKHKLCDYPGFIALDEEDLDVLRSGDVAFLWESPSAFSPEEAIDIARNAASKMAPEPGRVILAIVLYIIADSKSDLSTIEMIANIIHQTIAEDGFLTFGVAFCNKKGVRFLLSTTEKETLCVNCNKPARGSTY